LAETGVSAEDAVMIGDTSFDMAMGRAGGVQCIGVGWGYHPAASLHKAGAARVVEDMPALANALDEMWEQ
jgi:phosphoglycolate phosphatase